MFAAMGIPRETAWMTRSCAAVVAAATSACAATPARSFTFDDGWDDKLAAVGTPAPAPQPMLTPSFLSPLPSADVETTPDPKKPTPPPARCPAEMSLVLESVCIDRWEASLVQKRDDGSEAPWSPYHSPTRVMRRVRAVSKQGVVPQGYISGEQASAACQASGKRLCATFEWEAACRGAKMRLYPYGNQRRKGVCNDDGRRGHPVVEAHRTLGLSDERMWYEGMSLPLINQQTDTLDKTGERGDCTNETETYDMVGNLHEWVADEDGTFRGGFYMATQINGEGCDYATTAHPMSYADYSTGFRCCRDAAPKSRSES